MDIPNFVILLHTVALFIVDIDKFLMKYLRRL